MKTSTTILAAWAAGTVVVKMTVLQKESWLVCAAWPIVLPIAVLGGAKR